MECEYRINVWLVWGYIRSIESLLYMAIPVDIYDMIYSYGNISEYFIHCGSGIIISLDQMTVDFVTNISSYTAYGVVRIPSYKNNKKYIWSIRANNIAEDGLICIGIVDATQNRSFTQFHTDSCRLYGVESNCDDGLLIWDKRGSQNMYLMPRINDSDILTIILDMKIKRIRFKVNGYYGDKVVAVKRIEKERNLEYKLAVTMKGDRTSVTLNSFEIIDVK